MRFNLLSANAINGEGIRLPSGVSIKQGSAKQRVLREQANAILKAVSVSIDSANANSSLVNKLTGRVRIETNKVVSLLVMAKTYTDKQGELLRESYPDNITGLINYLKTAPYVSAKRLERIRDTYKLADKMLDEGAYVRVGDLMNEYEKTVPSNASELLKTYAPKPMTAFIVGGSLIALTLGFNADIAGKKETSIATAIASSLVKPSVIEPSLNIVTPNGTRSQKLMTYSEAERFGLFANKLFGRPLEFTINAIFNGKSINSLNLASVNMPEINEASMLDTMIKTIYSTNDLSPSQRDFLVNAVKNKDFAAIEQLAQTNVGGERKELLNDILSFRGEITAQKAVKEKLNTLLVGKFLEQAGNDLNLASANDVKTAYASYINSIEGSINGLRKAKTYSELSAILDETLSSKELEKAAKKAVTIEAARISKDDNYTIDEMVASGKLDVKERDELVKKVDEARSGIDFSSFK